MATYRLSPQERASVIARKVDRLFVRNRDYFLSHAETFRREGAERKKRAREKDAEQFRAVEDWRPGPDPTPAVMVTLLAALHDECLPDSPPILGLASGTGASVRQSRDPGLLALLEARVWCVCAKQGATDRLDALETYLNRAKADIEAAGVVVEGGKAEVVESESTSHEARALALLVEHPDWTDKQIAEHVPCHAKSLYRWPRFKAARNAEKQGRNDLPCGTKYPDGDGSSQVEAWDSDQA